MRPAENGIVESTMADMDDLYAVSMDHSAGGGVLHGACAEKEWPGGLPMAATPVFYGDSWRGEVRGTCASCDLFVDPDDVA
jgi:hypothetical protein